MGGNSPDPFSQQFNVAKEFGLQYNTSVQGTPIPIVFGTQRVSINLIQEQNFQTEGNGLSKKGGGKGGTGSKSNGGWGKKGPPSGPYSVDFAAGVCQGPVSFLDASFGTSDGNRIWANGGVQYGLSKVELVGAVGNDGQDPIIDGWNGSPSIGYSGTCVIGASPINLGNAPALPNIQFEITGFERGTAGASFPDCANPSNIIIRLCTDDRWGAGFPLDNIDQSGSFADFANYCLAAGFGMGLLLDRQQPVSNWLEMIAQLCTAAIFWSGTKLKIIPYISQTISNYGYTWVPNLTPVYIITDDDILPPSGSSLSDVPIENSDDPIMVTRADPQQVPNFLTIEWLDASNAYNIAVDPYFLQGDIDLYGLKTAPTVQGHAFTKQQAAIASLVAVTLDRHQIRNTPIKLRLGWRHHLLEPMDVIAVTDATVGYANQLLRIESIEEDENGELLITARDPPGAGLGVPNRQNTFPTDDVLGAVPKSINEPFIFEPTAQMIAAYGLPAGVLIIGLSAGPAGVFDPNWGGCEVHSSLDNVNYGYFGSFEGPSTMGPVSTTFPAYSGANPDTGTTLSVNLSESNGSLTSTSSINAAAFITLCCVKDASGCYELLSYETANLTAANQYDLTTLYRGLYGTVSDAKASADFLYLGNMKFFVFQMPPQWSTQPTIYFKFPSFNKLGGNLQDISDATLVATYTYSPTAAGQPTSVSPTLTALLGGSPVDLGAPS